MSGEQKAGSVRGTGGVPTGLTKDVGWEIGVSRTFAAPLPAAWDLLTSAAGLHRWLGPGAALPESVGESYRTADGTTGELRSLRERDRIRLTWLPAGRAGRPTTLQVALTGDDSKVTVRFHQEHLADSAERERQRRHWGAVLDELETLLLPAAS